ncbi:hypothetical protein [Streptomyces sp. SD31]|uniref:hypothetical protein n=1 Tax=Streptomyces sp. SD31 TaxID=3452208 RepID=UPI003F8ADAD4
MDDLYDDFVGRYTFAFWRLIAQGVTAAGAPQTAAGGHTAASGADTPSHRMACNRRNPANLPVTARTR